jgi:Ca2+-dependent lipid-binding protein
MDKDSILNEVTQTAVRENLNDYNESQTPADKQAEAEKKAQVVLDSLPQLKSQAAIPNDQATNDSKTLANAIVNADAKPVKQALSKEKAPGSFISDSKVGWDAFSKLPNPGNEEAIEELASKLGLDALIGMYKGSRTSNKNEQDLVSQFLKEAYYGEWYHNTAVMLFSVVFTWILTRFGGGLMACLVVGAFLATYYQTSIRRLRRNVRDDIQRELAINRLETETESADWINHFMSRFWLIYEPVLSAQIIGIADAILVDSTPAFLDSIRLTSFTLGTKAPRIESIKTLTKTEPNVVVK